MQISTRRGVLIVIGATALMLALGQWWWQTQGHRQHAYDPLATRLYEAIMAGDVVQVEAMLDEHPTLLDFRFGTEGTALHVAARADQPEIVALLIGRGLDPTARGQWDGTPLHWAGWWGASKAVAELLKHAPDVEDKGDFFGSTPLLWTCHGSVNAPRSKGNYVATVKALLAAGAQADTTNAQGVRAIDLASEPVAEVLKAEGVAPPGDKRGPSSRPSGPSMIVQKGSDLPAG